MNNIGDYTSDPVRWPNGLGAIRDRIHAAGLQIGLHIISPGSTVCLDQMTLPTSCTAPHSCHVASCKGNIHIDTAVSRNHPEFFMPQGPAPTGWYWARPAPSPSPDFVPGLPHVILIELRWALVSYQDYHILLLLTLAGQYCRHMVLSREAREVL